MLYACKSDAARLPPSDTSKRSEPAESLVMTSKDGAEIWFTLSRIGRAADGTTCVERGLEIRRDGTRIKVPLLYTGSPPVLLDESKMRAELWNHCRPVGTYIVDLRSGRPVREGAESSS
jgi:hypothetical protein